LCWACRSDSLLLEKKLVSNSSFSANKRFDDEATTTSSISTGSALDGKEDLCPPIPLMPDEAEEVNAALAKASTYARRVSSTVAPRSDLQKDLLAAHAGSGLELLHRDLTVTEEVLLSDLETFLNASDAKDRGMNTHHAVGSSSRDNVLFLQRNVAEVHLELAVLEGVGQFSHSSAVRFGTSAFSAGTGGASDVSSCVFHLCEASVLGSCAAALSLARLHYGLTSSVLASLANYVPRNLEVALDLFLLAAHRGSATAVGYAAEISAQLQGMTMLELLE
jgi:hypothetical protein